MTSDPESVAERLLRLVERVTAHPPEPVGPQTPIFATGLFDSLALVELATWIEQEIGAPVDSSAIDVEREWATVGDVLRFVERHRGPAGSGVSRTSKAVQQPLSPSGIPAGQYELTTYRPELKPAICELQQHLWSPDPLLNAEYFAWKYEANPYSAAPHVYLALLDGRPVAMRGLMGGLWEAGSPATMENVLTAGDLVIAPEHRGRGLLRRILDFALAEAAREDVAYLVNLSAGPATRLGSLAAGWGSTEALTHLSRRPMPSRWTRVRSALRRNAADDSGDTSPFARIDRRIRRSGGRLGRGICIADHPQPDAMAELIRRIGHDGRIRHVRDTTYLTWRFRNPRSEYRFIFLERGRLQAYLIVQARRGSRTPGNVRLLDWEGETAEARRAVLDAAFRGLIEARTELTGSLRPPEDADALRRVGFVPRPARSLAESRTVLTRPVQPREEGHPWRLGGHAVLDLASWDVRELYSDGT